MPSCQVASSSKHAQQQGQQGQQAGRRTSQRCCVHSYGAAHRVPHQDGRWWRSLPQPLQVLLHVSLAAPAAAAATSGAAVAAGGAASSKQGAPQRDHVTRQRVRREICFILCHRQAVAAQVGRDHAVPVAGGAGSAVG